MGLSKLSAECEKCKYRGSCDNKRMAACAVAEMPKASSVTISFQAPSNDINSNIAEQLKKDFHRQMLKVHNSIY